MRVPDETVAAALAGLRQASCELNAPDLYGPDDSTLTNVSHDPLFGESWQRHRPFQAVGLRIPRFQISCFRTAIERGEICAQWESPPPRTPVNEVGLVLQYLQEQWVQNLQLRSADERTDESVVETMRQVFRNAWHTSVWFYGQGKLSESPIEIREPKTMTAVRKYLLRFDGWLRRARVEKPSPTSPSGLPPQSPREIQAISPMPTEDVTTTTQSQVASHAHWIHNADEAPPSTHQFGPLTGTRAELGRALRRPDDDGKSETAQRALLAQKARTGIVWVRRCAGETPLDAFFRSNREFDAATERIATLRRRKKAKANATKRKSATVNASKRK